MSPIINYREIGYFIQWLEHGKFIKVERYMAPSKKLISWNDDGNICNIYRSENGRILIGLSAIPYVKEFKENTKVFYGQ